jgi:hypothetical protein
MFYLTEGVIGALIFVGLVEPLSKCPTEDPVSRSINQ